MQAGAYDIIQVGYGPVSELLALILDRARRSVVVCERWRRRYASARAVCVDHEPYGVLAADGMGGCFRKITVGGSPYQWFNADWRELLVIGWSAPSISGGGEVSFVHQPTLEEAVDQAVTQLSTGDLHSGWDAVEVRQDEQPAHVDLINVETGASKTLSARYLIGCDGGNSIVREAIGGAREDRGFEADWLVIDVLLKEGVTIEQLGVPAAGQYRNPIHSTTIVPAAVRDGRVYRRWEFMRLPGQRPEDLEPEGGILAWKRGLILDGNADDSLLDTYQRKRQPHVSQITDISIYLGKIICMPDPDKAARRGAAFLGGTAPQPPLFPHITEGILDRREDGKPADGARLLAPHVELLVMVRGIVWTRLSRCAGSQ